MFLDNELYCVQCKSMVVGHGCECTEATIGFDEVGMTKYVIWMPDYWKDIEKMKHHDMQRFSLKRLEDETGISGTGYVAEGVEFTHGKCVLVWLTEPGSNWCIR